MSLPAEPAPTRCGAASAPASGGVSLLAPEKTAPAGPRPRLAGEGLQHNERGTRLLAGLGQRGGPVLRLAPWAFPELAYVMRDAPARRMYEATVSTLTARTIFPTNYLLPHASTNEPRVPAQPRTPSRPELPFPGGSGGRWIVGILRGSTLYLLRPPPFRMLSELRRTAETAETGRTAEAS